jgi:predicted amidophosphoribosyltransferase
MLPSDSNVCPYCGRKNPTGSYRCPKCMNPVKKEFLKCSVCGQDLYLYCSKCGEKTFYDDQCEHCGASLMIQCPNPKCRAEQAPVRDKCYKCGKALKK